MEQNYLNRESYKNNKKRKRKNVIITIVLSLSILLTSAVSSVLTYSFLSSDFENRYAVLQNDYNLQLTQLNSKLNSINISQNILPVSVSSALNGLSITEIAQKLNPSIVGIRVTIPSTRVTNGFFSWQTGESRSEGSGIIISSDGYIATNNHVVESCTTNTNALIEVVLSDGTIHIASFVAADTINDLAVLKIDVSDLIPAELGKSSELQVGETAIAIGNPLGLEFQGSVTVGIISALNRTINSENVAENLIQTDAAINPGNSGGALINSRGQVIGINTIKISSTGVEGLGFAIPIDAAREIIEQLIEFGYVPNRAAIGISGEELTSGYASRYNLPRGLLVTNVTPNGAADLLGFTANNTIIITIDGISIRTMNDLQKVLKNHKSGDTVVISYWQNNEIKEKNITFMEDK